MYSNTGSIIVDIVLLALIILSIVIGAKKGLTLALLELVIVVVALVGAMHLTNRIETPIADYLYPKLEVKLDQMVDSADLALDGVDLQAIVLIGAEKDKLSDSDYQMLLKNEGIGKVVETLTRFGISEETIRNEMGILVKKTKQGNTGLKDLLQEFARNLSARILKVIVRVVCILVIFVVLLLILKLLSRGLDALVDAIPIINSLNVLFGAVFGAAELAVVLFVGLYFLVHAGFENFNAMVNDSLLLELLVKSNPITMFFG